MFLSTVLDPCKQQGINCHAAAQCVEGVIGGWQCLCNDGYIGNGQQCTGSLI